jgi:hypothetical protein
VIILDEMDTLAQAVGLLCVSIAAWGAGGLVSATLIIPLEISLDEITILGIPVFATVQACLVVLAGTLTVTREKRAASAQRARTVQSQYQDVDEELA